MTRSIWVECHTQVLSKLSQAYLGIIKEMETGMDRFKKMLPTHRNVPEVNKLHRSMTSRLEFYCAKLKGIENYAHTTLERLKIQRNAVSAASLYSLLVCKGAKRC